MKRFFQYFGFSQLEQYGFSVLTLFIVLIFFLPYGLKLIRDDEELNYELIFLDHINNEPVPIDNLSFLDYKSNNGKVKKKEISYFFFDPNGLDETKWAKLGFSPKQIQVIKNYEAKGGRFYRKEDVAKIYAISPRDYERIAPYIRIDITANQFEAKVINKSLIADTRIDKVVKGHVNINLADTTVWKSLRGIGSVYASRIVKYRDLLGGFTNIDQLREVYGISTETMESIRPYLSIDMESTVLRKLNVNTSSVVVLSRHPYINRKQAQTIVNYRIQHGDFQNIESLQLIQSLDNDFFRKIGEYLEY